MIKNKLLLFLIVFIMAGLPQFAWSAPWSVASSQTVVIGTSAPVSTLDPGRSFDVPTQRVLSFMFETLVQAGAEPGQVKPLLAESWNVSADRLVWTFNLRGDVYFHDGRPFTATAAANSMRRLFDYSLLPAGSGRKDYQWFSVLLGGPVPLLRHVKAIDKRTLEFHLQKPVSNFLEIMANPALAIVAPSCLSEAGHRDFSPVGTGPFQFVEHRQGQRLTLRSFGGYWNNSPFIDNVVIICLPDALARQREFSRGNIDIALGLDTLAVSELNELRPQKLNSQAWGRWSLVMNCEHRPFRDVRSRLALQYALPKEQIMKRFAGSRSSAAVGYLRPRPQRTVPADFYNYDPHKAKRLLDRVFGNDERPVLNMLYCREAVQAGNPDELAAFIGGRLSACGLDVKLQGLDSAAFRYAAGCGFYDILLDTREMPYSDSGVELSGDWGIAPASGSDINISRYANGRLQNYLQIARTTASEASRAAVYAKAEQMLMSDAAYLPIGWIMPLNVARSNLQAVKMNRLGQLDLTAAYYDE